MGFRGRHVGQIEGWLKSCVLYRIDISEKLMGTVMCVSGACQRRRMRAHVISSSVSAWAVLHFGFDASHPLSSGSAPVWCPLLASAAGREGRGRGRGRANFAIERTLNDLACYAAALGMVSVILFDSQTVSAKSPRQEMHVAGVVLVTLGILTMHASVLVAKHVATYSECVARG